MTTALLRCSIFHFEIFFSVPSDAVITGSKLMKILFAHCSKVMSNTLRRDICGLKALAIERTDIDSSVVECFLPEHIQYACSHWADHFQQIDVQASDISNLYRFLKMHFTHWLEAMCL